MAMYGLLIDYDLCTGCHTCEIACANENGYSEDKSGMQVVELSQLGPRGPSKSWMAIPTVNCILCPKRRVKGLLPSCVEHCQAKCITYDTVQKLAECAKRKKIMWVP